LKARSQIGYSARIVIRVIVLNAENVNALQTKKLTQNDEPQKPSNGSLLADMIANTRELFGNCWQQ
jgi:hypothetical protein